MYLTELFGAYTPIKRYLLAYVFPPFKAVCVLWILIGLLDCLRLLWLANFSSSDVGIFFLELNSKSLYRSSKKEIESRCLVLTVSTKREIRHFHVEVV